jgi:5,10-methylenetetrahydromethanopterin reductase
MSDGFESIGIGFGGHIPIGALVELAALADQSNFRSLWIQENDATSTIVLAAAVLHATKRLILGTGITSPFRRHPQTLAVDAATLNELSKDRFILGMGAAERLIRTFRIRAEPIEGMRDAFAIIRGVYSSDDFTYDGKVFSVTTPQTRLTPKPRIYMGAIGPRMLDLVGELADGLIISRRAAFSSEYTKFAIRRVAEMASDVGRDPSEIDSVGFFETFLAKDGDEARRFAKKVLGAYTIPGTPQKVLELEGIANQDIEMIRTNYLKGNLDEAISNVTDDLVDKFALAGTPEECLSKLRAHIGTGLKCPILYIHGPNHKSAIQLAAEEIAPNLTSNPHD